MGVKELRQELHDYIETADITFLRMVHAMSREYKPSEIVGFNTDGSPITENELKTRVKAASKRVKAGDYVSGEDIEKEIENW